MMMNQQPQKSKLIVLPVMTAPVQRLDNVLDMLDQLHSSVSEGALDQHAAVNRAELVSLLRDIIYTAQETIAELEEQAFQDEFVLHIVERTS